MHDWQGIGQARATGAEVSRILHLNGLNRFVMGEQFLLFKLGYEL